MNRLDHFSLWFFAQGGRLHPAVEFASTASQGFELRVKHSSESGPLRKGSTAIWCPYTLSLSALNAIGRELGTPDSLLVIDNVEKPGRYLLFCDIYGMPPLSPLPTRVLNYARPQFIAAVWLCAHYLRGDRSPWNAYIAILPRPTGELPGLEPGARPISASPIQGPGVIDTAIWWGQEEKDWIEGTNLARGAKNLEAAWLAEWETFADEIGIWAEKNNFEAGKLNWTLFKWAVSIYGSRAFSSTSLSSVVSPATRRPVLMDSDPHALLYPGMDMLNHCDKTANRWFSDSNGFGLIFYDEPQPGETVWHSYGKKGNAELLLSYGFCLKDNKSDAFSLQISPPKLPPIRLQLLEQLKKAEASPSKPSAGFNIMQPENPLSVSTRFSSGQGIPHASCSRDETEILESQDLDDNIFYIRWPIPDFKETDPDIKNLDALNFDPARQGYLINRVSGFRYLSGIPVTLLQHFSVVLATDREIKEAIEVMDSALGSTVQDCEESKLLMWQLGTRNELAVVSLLIQRFSLEGRRLWGLLRKHMLVENTAGVSSIANVETTTHGSARPVQAARKEHARTLLLHQSSILSVNVTRMSERFLGEIAGYDKERLERKKTEKDIAGYDEENLEREEANKDINLVIVCRDFSHDGANDASNRDVGDEDADDNDFLTILSRGRTFLTCMELFCCLQSIAPTVTTEYNAVLRGPRDNPCDNNMLRKKLHDSRRNAQDQQIENMQNLEEDEAMAVLLGLIFITLFRSETDKYLDDNASRLAKEMRKWTIWHDEYGFGMNNAHTNSVQSGGSAISDFVDAMYQKLNLIRKNIPKTMGIWSHDTWWEPGFVRACAQVVLEGTAMMPVPSRAYDMFAEAEEGRRQELKEYLCQIPDEDEAFGEEEKTFLVMILPVSKGARGS